MNAPLFPVFPARSATGDPRLGDQRAAEAKTGQPPSLDRTRAVSQAMRDRQAFKIPHPNWHTLSVWPILAWLPYVDTLLPALGALDETRQGRPVYTLDHRRPPAARSPILDACDHHRVRAAAAGELLPTDPPDPEQREQHGSSTRGDRSESAFNRSATRRPSSGRRTCATWRPIKRRVTAKEGFREFHAARRTIQGYEAMHMIRKGQARRLNGSDVRQQIQFINKLFEVAA